MIARVISGIVHVEPAARFGAISRRVCANDFVSEISRDNACGEQDANERDGDRQYEIRRA